MALAPACWLTAPEVTFDVTPDLYYSSVDAPLPYRTLPVVRTACVEVRLSNRNSSWPAVNLSNTRGVELAGAIGRYRDRVGCEESQDRGICPRRFASGHPPTVLAPRTRCVDRSGA